MYASAWNAAPREQESEDEQAACRIDGVTDPVANFRVQSQTGRARSATGTASPARPERGLGWTRRLLLTQEAAEEKACGNGEPEGLPRVCRDVLTRISGHCPPGRFQAVALLVQPCGCRRRRVGDLVNRLVGNFRGAVDCRPDFARRVVSRAGHPVYRPVDAGCGLVQVCVCRAIARRKGGVGARFNFHRNSPV